MNARPFMPCRVPGCDGDAGRVGTARGFCTSHYKRWRDGRLTGPEYPDLANPDPKPRRSYAHAGDPAADRGPVPRAVHGTEGRGCRCPTASPMLIHADGANVVVCARCEELLPDDALRNRGNNAVPKRGSNAVPRRQNEAGSVEPAPIKPEVAR